MRDRRQDESGERSTPPTSSTPPSTARRSPRGGPISPSNDSMAYSIDDSTAFRLPVAHTNITNDGDNQSLLSYVTRSTMVQSSPSRQQSYPSETATHTQEEDGDDISLSLLESNSTLVPSDEELHAIGWAKALDANSGSYYYFTLDRSKTVWENPLATPP